MVLQIKREEIPRVTGTTSAPPPCDSLPQSHPPGKQMLFYQLMTSNHTTVTTTLKHVSAEKLKPEWSMRAKSIQRVEDESCRQAPGTQHPSDATSSSVFASWPMFFIQPLDLQAAFCLSAARLCLLTRRSKWPHPQHTCPWHITATWATLKGGERQQSYPPAALPAAH